MSTPVEQGLCQCGCGRKTSLAYRSRKRPGWVKGEPLRFVLGHAARRPRAERFWSKVDRRGPDECWPWTGTQSRGYGSLFDGGRNRVATHVSWELFHGRPLPGGMWVLHRCDNPPCVNPRHLFLGTQRDNMRDKAEKGRAPRGESHYRSKLTTVQVREILRRIARGETKASIAREHGVKPYVISFIASGATWNHVGPKRKRK